MGLSIKELVPRKEITLKDLSNKVVAIDTMNMLYQFLTTIRGMDGSLLTDKKGRVTSHLIGLFARTTVMMENGIKPIFVFDGTPPALKQKTWEKRKQAKLEANAQLQVAEEAGDYEQMKKLSARTAVLTKEMVADAQKVITALGLPIINAPSEGEAQAAYMVRTKHAYACISQDYDTLIFGAPRLVRNLSVEGKRRKKGTLAIETISPEEVILEDVLTSLKLTQDQLIVLAVLIGTDYNPGGIKGIGPKKALKLLQEHENQFDKIFELVKWKETYPELAWKEVFDTIKHIPVTDHFTLEWKRIDSEQLRTLLVDEFNFSAERVEMKLSKLGKEQTKMSQKGLSQFF